MSGRILPFLLLHIALDVYMYFGLKSMFRTPASIRLFSIIYLLTVIGTYYAFFRLNSAVIQRNIFSGTEVNVYIGIIITSLVTKLVFCAGLFIQDFGRIVASIILFVKGMFRSGAVSAEVFLPDRRDFLTLAAAGAASIPFLSLLYGFTRGKYRYTVERLKLSFKDLPAAFDGYRVVQISDIHAGSLDSVEQVRKGIEMVNALDPDVILFTGDLVNSRKEEINPYRDVLRELKARDGVYAVLGNHDYYGLYGFDNQKDKDTYWQSFMDTYQDLGFELLNNTSRVITRGTEAINILGVENWGRGRWFPKYGDLERALSGANGRFNILMSHDPTHWDEKVLPHKEKIHLTLSGHTHGFQFGVNLPGFKWSPAKYRYPRWIGKYEEDGQVLYVNRGFGFLAFPGRVGMWPEITLLELSSEV